LKPLVLLQPLVPLQVLDQGQEVGVWLAVQKDQDVVSDFVHPDCLQLVRLRIVARRLGLAVERSAQSVGRPPASEQERERQNPVLQLLNAD
jgi:hypothetical protein